MSNLNRQTVAQLQAIAEQQGIEIPEEITLKKDLVEFLEGKVAAEVPGPKPKDPTDKVTEQASTAIPQPRQGQTILGRKNRPGGQPPIYRWWTPQAWKAIPALNVEDKKGNRTKGERQGWEEVNPQTVKKAPERIN